MELFVLFFGFIMGFLARPWLAEYIPYLAPIEVTKVTREGADTFDKGMARIVTTRGTYMARISVMSTPQRLELYTVTMSNVATGKDVPFGRAKRIEAAARAWTAKNW